jgi:diguanylate cyclase (GGDEF)-like protein/PAS domain S-box-containing protein
VNEAVIQILLVDDDSEDAFLTRELLADVPTFKCQVTTVDDASAAIEHLLTHTYDVCLLDYRLGAQTGIDVLKTVLAQGCTVPCILLTGQGDAETDAMALAAGAVDYLVKGRFHGDSLTRTIRYAIRNAQSLQSLRMSESRFRSVIEAATDAIVVVDDAGIIESWNPRTLDLFAYSAEHFTELSLFSMFAIDQHYVSVQELENDLAGQNESSEIAIELVGKPAVGAPFPCELTLSSWQSETGLRWCIIIRDATKRKAMEAELVHQAFHDSLTNLANRSLFRNRVSHALVRLSRVPGFVSVLFCDLDNFKRINDTLGHGAGDELLIAAGNRLIDCIRGNDTAARLGGDEFAILVEDAKDPKVAIQVAERVLLAFSRPFKIAGRDVIISTSVGIDIAITNDATADDLIRNADVAMYIAKDAGKSRYAMFESSMHQTLVARLQMEQDLRLAIQNDEIAVHYQPILRLPGLQLRGFEALARWIHPTRGVVSPVDFIPLAEELGLIEAIGHQVLRKACRALRAWQIESGRDDLVVSVNLSSRQLERDGLDELVASELAQAGLSAKSLILEITESVIMQDPAATGRRLEKIAALGIKIAVDDFGTGYSSLSYLRDLPVHILKVDRSFVRYLGDPGRGAALVDAIIAMAHSLNMETVAEGVETDLQHDHLNDSGCDFVQGFLFARPLSVEATGAFLLEHQQNAMLVVK